MLPNQITSSLFLLFAFVLAFASPPQSHALSLAPSIYEGSRLVSVQDIDRKLVKASRKDGVDLIVLARLHQIAYAQKSSALPVETWGGTDYYPWVYDDPGAEKILPPADAKQEQQAKRHLAQASRYFSDLVRLPPPKLVIGGLQGTFERRQLKAYRGLIWCLQQEGKDTEIRKIYPDYMKLAAKSDESEALSAWLMIQPYAGADSDLKPRLKQIERVSPAELFQRWDRVARQHKSPYSIWQAKADLHMALYSMRSEEVYARETGGYHRYYLERVVPGPQDKAQDPAHLRQAVELYEKILAVPEAEHKTKSDSPWLVVRDRLNIKLNLIRAQSETAAREETLKRYNDLLEEAIGFDTQTQDTAFSIGVWRQMQPYLDANKDADYILAAQKRLKDAQIREHMSPLFY